MENYSYPLVTEENFAAWLDGTLSPDEESLFLEKNSNNKDFQELLDANDQVDESYETMVEDGYELPEEFKTDFDIPVVYDISDDNDECDYDNDVEPYDATHDDEDQDEDEDEDDSDFNHEDNNYHSEEVLNHDYDQDDYDVL